MNRLRTINNRLLLAGVTLLTAATLLLSILASGQSTMAGDVTILNTIQQIDLPGVTTTVNFFNWSGRLLPYLMITGIIAAVFYARGLRSEAALVVIAVTLSQAANAGLKLLVGSPRPTGDLVQASQQTSGYGFPSGHTMTTFVVVGMLLYLLLKDNRWSGLRFAAVIVGLMIVLGMGFSRIYIGAHWPSDVVGAYLWGGICLLAVIAVYRWLTAENFSWRRPG